MAAVSPFTGRAAKARGINDSPTGLQGLSYWNSPKWCSLSHCPRTSLVPTPTSVFGVQNLATYSCLLASWFLFCITNRILCTVCCSIWCAASFETKRASLLCPFVVESRSVWAGRLGKLELPSRCAAPSGNCTVMRGLCSHSPLGFLIYLQIDKIVCYLSSPNILLHLIAAFFANCCPLCPRLLMR